MREDFYGDNFKWFVGVVKDSAGDKNRVRVRIFGIHRINDTTKVSDGDLPYALVLYPTTGGQSSGGSMSHGLKNGDWVFGFFADGDDCMQPVVIGIIDGGLNSSSTVSSSTATDPGASTGEGSGSTTDKASSNNPTVEIPGSTNEQKAYNMIRSLIEKSGRSGGDIHAQVCGIMGNIYAESKFNISSYNPNDKGQPSFGICQWRAERRIALIRAYGNSPSLEQQISFMFDEFNKPDINGKAFKRILSAKNIDEATQAMCFFERPQCYKGTHIDTNDETYKPRIAAAQRYYKSMKYTPPESTKTVGRGDR